MAAPGTQDVPTTASVEMVMEKTAQRGRGHTLPWILFLVIGIPFGLMAALGPLTAAGIYIEPLRGLWQPWPPDLAKPFIGAAAFVVTFAYLVYRTGRIRGFHWGTVAATAVFRNIVEGRGSGTKPDSVPLPPTPQDAPATSTDPPILPPEAPGPSAPPPIEPALPEQVL